MVEANAVLIIANIIILLIVIILSLIYLLSIILVPRFHTATNILTGNVCLTTIIACVFWAAYNILSTYYPTILIQLTAVCFIFTYFQGLVNSLLVYSLAMVTINRFFTIIYPNKRLFKSRAWPFISSGIQWIFAIMLSLPHLLASFQACVYKNQQPYWIFLYSLLVIVILPSIISTIFNALIFVNVRSSTRRVHVEALTTTVATNPNQLNARDVHLLKHMLFMFVVFIVGWAPIYILYTINTNTQISQWVLSLIQLLAIFSILINIVDLFLYNRELRQYLKERLFNRRN